MSVSKTLQLLEKYSSIVLKTLPFLFQYWQENINSSRIQHVTLLSVGGGYRDFQVRTGLTSLEGIVPESRGLSVMVSFYSSIYLFFRYLG